MQTKTPNIIKITDKLGSPVTLEWYKVEDLDTCINLGKQILPIYAKAFADNIMPLLDANFEIKKEFLELYGKVSIDFREKIDEQKELAFDRKNNRANRVESTKEYVLQMVDNGLVDSLINCKPVVVFAKDKENKVLGFALFLRKYPDPSAISGFPKNLVPAVNFTENNAVYLHHLAIVPEAQGRGLARFLIFSILDIMPEINRIILDTDFWNTKSQAIYQKFGFNEIGRRPYDQVAIFEYIKK